MCDKRVDGFQVVAKERMSRMPTLVLCNPYHASTAMRARLAAFSRALYCPRKYKCRFRDLDRMVSLVWCDSHLSCMPISVTCKSSVSMLVDWSATNARKGPSTDSGSASSSALQFPSARTSFLRANFLLAGTSLFGSLVSPASCRQLQGVHVASTACGPHTTGVRGFFRRAYS